MKKFMLYLVLSISSISVASTFDKALVDAAIERTTYKIIYNGSYFSIPYPNGDVPKYFGVCTDVIIRSYRAIGTDLQQLVHEDMHANFLAYPSKRIWGMKGTDKNIDHRRVPNLQAFFTRHGSVLKISKISSDYKAGDIVTWMLKGNTPHIGIVTNLINSKTGNPMIVRNIGWGPETEDMLFDFKITGHYRYVPEKYEYPSETQKFKSKSNNYFG